MDELAELAEAGWRAAPVEVTPLGGGVVGRVRLVRWDDGSRCVVKTISDDGFGDPADTLEIEAEGLAALSATGAVRTPRVLYVSPRVLVLEPLHESPTDGDFRAELGRRLAVLHTTTVGERFGWHRDGWLGRKRQDNTWNDDGHDFVARQRLLRYLPEPRLRDALGPSDRRALRRLCSRLPEILPVSPPVLTHGDLWTGNVLATADGVPALVDPAVCYGVAEMDLSMLWCAGRPEGMEGCFAAYQEISPLEDGWRHRMRILYLRELLCTLAHAGDVDGTGDAVREILSPFRTTAGPTA